MKKIVSFLVILLLVSMVAWLLFEPFLQETLWPDSVASRRARYALSQDDRGNLYLLEDQDGTNRLMAMDMSGNVLLDEELPVITDALTYHIDGFYVASTKNMLVAVSELDRETERVRSIALHLFYESGAYVTELLHIDCDESGYGTGGTFFTSFSESETHVYFGLHQNGRIKLYEVEKGRGEEGASLLRDVEVSGPLAGAAVMPSQDIVTFPLSGGLMVYPADSVAPREIALSNITPRALFPIDGQRAYLHDAASGGIYEINLTTSAFTSYFGAGELLTSDSEVRCGMLDFLHVNPHGRLAGMAERQDADALFSGTRLLMNRIALAEESDSFWRILGVAAIALGVLLLSVLLHDAYCRLLKMRLYIMVRQALLILAGVGSMLYCLSTLVLEPSLERMFTEQYQSRLLAAGGTLGQAVSGSDEESIERIFDALTPREGGTPIHFDLFDAESGQLIVSSDGYAAGTSARLMPHRTDMRGMLDLAAADGVYQTEIYETTGQRAYSCIRLEDDRVLAASAGMEDITLRIAELTKRVSLFIFIAGAVLVTLLLLIESITVHSIRRLRKGVEAVSAGEYGATIRIHSGDEVENLANSFNTMTRLIRGSMENLGRLNRAYYRFVPENMIKLLGARDVADLDRGSCAKKRMTIMLVRFRFEKGEPQDTDALFKNINRVMQELTQAVPENGGTVYDLRSDGFSAVFERGSEDGVRAALKVRANAHALNERAEKEGARKVDVRLVITEGDVMLGVVGDQTRLSPTAISDVIADAERMMAIAEPSNLYICCTEKVMRAIKGYRSRYIGLFEMTHSLERIYDLYDGDPFDCIKHKEMCAQRFDGAVEAFYKRDFARAKMLFMEVVQFSLSDKVSVNYMYFADQYLHGAPETLSYRALEGKGPRLG